MALILLLKTNLDVASTISSVVAEIDEASSDKGDQWQYARVRRTNISWDHVIEELSFAGCNVEEYQTHVHGSQSIRSVFDCVPNQHFYLTGHVSDPAVARVATNSCNMEIWDNYAIAAESSPNAVKNIAGSMFTGFEGGSNGIEPVSPIMQKLETGNVIVELHGGESEESDAAIGEIVRLFVHIATQQQIESFVMVVPSGSSEVTSNHGAMTLFSNSSQFNAHHIESAGSVNSLARHLSAHVSGTDVAVLAALTEDDNSLQDDELREASLFFTVHREGVTLYHTVVLDEDLLLEGDERAADAAADADRMVVKFDVAFTENIHDDMRRAYSQLTYKIKNEASDETYDPREDGGIFLNSTLFDAAQQMCGHRSVNFEPVDDDAREQEENDTQSEAKCPQLTDTDRDCTKNVVLSLPSVAKTVSRTRSGVGECVDAESVAEQHAASGADVALAESASPDRSKLNDVVTHNKSLLAEVAMLRNELEGTSGLLSECRADTSAIRILSDSVRDGLKDSLSAVAGDEPAEDADVAGAHQVVQSLIENGKRYTQGVQNRLAQAARSIMPNKKSSPVEDAAAPLLSSASKHHEEVQSSSESESDSEEEEEEDGANATWQGGQMSAVLSAPSAFLQTATSLIASSSGSSSKPEEEEVPTSKKKKAVSSSSKTNIKIKNSSLKGHARDTFVKQHLKHLIQSGRSGLIKKI